VVVLEQLSHSLSPAPLSIHLNNVDNKSLEWRGARQHSMDRPTLTTADLAHQNKRMLKERALQTLDWNMTPQRDIPSRDIAGGRSFSAEGLDFRLRGNGTEQIDSDGAAGHGALRKFCGLWCAWCSGATTTTWEAGEGQRRTDGGGAAGFTIVMPK
jgi:hypothetical protein